MSFYRDPGPPVTHAALRAARDANPLLDQIILALAREARTVVAMPLLFSTVLVCPIAKSIGIERGRVENLLRTGGCRHVERAVEAELPPGSRVQVTTTPDPEVIAIIQWGDTQRMCERAGLAIAEEIQEYDGAGITCCSLPRGVPMLFTSNGLSLQEAVGRWVVPHLPQQIRASFLSSGALIAWTSPNAFDPALASRLAPVTLAMGAGDSGMARRFNENGAQGWQWDFAVTMTDIQRDPDNPKHDVLWCGGIEQARRVLGQLRAGEYFIASGQDPDVYVIRRHAREMRRMDPGTLAKSIISVVEQAVEGRKYNDVVHGAHGKVLDLDTFTAAKRVMELGLERLHENNPIFVRKALGYLRQIRAFIHEGIWHLFILDTIDAVDISRVVEEAANVPPDISKMIVDHLM